jgi:predicted transcriptional regulator
VDIPIDPITKLDWELDFKQFLSRLSNLDAKIYLNHEKDKMTYAHIALILGVSDQTVRRSVKETDKKLHLFFK